MAKNKIMKKYIISLYIRERIKAIAEQMLTIVLQSRHQIP